jgi:hypothetical protein
MQTTNLRDVAKPPRRYVSKLEKAQELADDGVLVNVIHLGDHDHAVSQPSEDDASTLAKTEYFPDRRRHGGLTARRDRCRNLQNFCCLPHVAPKPVRVGLSPQFPDTLFQLGAFADLRELFRCFGETGSLFGRTGNFAANR